MPDPARAGPGQWTRPPRSTLAPRRWRGHRLGARASARRASAASDSCRLSGAVRRIGAGGSLTPRAPPTARNAAAALGGHGGRAEASGPRPGRSCPGASAIVASSSARPTATRHPVGQAEGRDGVGQELRSVARWRRAAPSRRVRPRSRQHQAGQAPAAAQVEGVPAESGPTAADEAARACSMWASTSGRARGSRASGPRVSHSRRPVGSAGPRSRRSSTAAQSPGG